MFGVGSAHSMPCCRFCSPRLLQASPRGKKGIISYLVFRRISSINQEYQILGKEAPALSWKCPRNAWKWHSVLKVGTGHSLDFMLLEGFSNLNNSKILSRIKPWDIWRWCKSLCWARFSQIPFFSLHLLCCSYLYLFHNFSFCFVLPLLGIVPLHPPGSSIPVLILTFPNPRVQRFL